MSRPPKTGHSLPTSVELAALNVAEPEPQSRTTEGENGLEAGAVERGRVDRIDSVPHGPRSDESGLRDGRAAAADSQALDEAGGRHYQLQRPALFPAEIAKLLNEGALLYKIRVEKQSDYLKGTQAHHKAKRKEMVVYVQKDKPLLAKNTLKLSTVSEEDNSNTASGSKPRDRHKNKSKEKTTGAGKPQLAGRTGKNQRKRENRPQLVINDYHNEQDLYSEEDTSVLDGMS
eukprot:CAMPEP_0185570480 /NCGR_PEP_ID=MMETSP0434-20130131/2781_1 /TAXON_ID=626734 ORGANISM="Favella taraikaensis, Strain Fe Narragansett Bay" /NCGR_SAMPLE_ID=MMETSP0434 /ASSEMBLY_ACC=CAM_ASM_000379 /LENGTH=230 /DNA_ID=CAMNT_0028185617 /DNA_START=675 /DNA_END=1369 /DNA_ORIENTATION=-